MPPSAADMARGFMDNSIASFDSNKENKINFNPNFKNAFNNFSNKIKELKSKKNISSEISESILNLINEIGEYPDFLFQQITQNAPQVITTNIEILFTAIGLLTNGLDESKFNIANQNISKIFLEGSKTTLTGGLGLLDIINAICSINPDITSDKLDKLNDVFEGTKYQDEFSKVKTLSIDKVKLELKRELKQLSYKERQVYLEFNLITNLLKNDAVKNHVNIYDFQDKINEIQSKYVKFTNTVENIELIKANTSGSVYVSKQLKIAMSEPLLLSPHQLYLYYINNGNSFSSLIVNSKYVAFDGIYYELTENGLNLNGNEIKSGQINSISDATKQEFEKIDEKMVETLNESLRKASEFVTTLAEIKTLLETTYTDTDNDKQEKQDSNDLKIFINESADTPSKFYNDMVGNLLSKAKPDSSPEDKPNILTIPFKQGLFLNHVMTYIENKLKFNEFKKNLEQPGENVPPETGIKAETKELKPEELEKLKELKKLIEKNCAVSNSFYFVLEEKTLNLGSNIPDELKNAYKFYTGKDFTETIKFEYDNDLFKKINEISQKQQKESGVLNINMVLDKKTKPGLFDFQVKNLYAVNYGEIKEKSIVKLNITNESLGTNEPKYATSTFYPKIPATNISFFNQAQITYLDMDGIKIVSLPDAIGYLSNLKVLRLKGCSLIEIPETIGRLGNLQYLKLKDNFLTELPYSIGNCSNLIILDVRENCLYKNGSNANSGYKIPGSLTELMEFRAIDFKGIVDEHNKQASATVGTAPAEQITIDFYKKLKYDKNNGEIIFTDDKTTLTSYNPEENYVGYKLTIENGGNKREISSYGFYFLYNHQKNKGDKNYEHALQLVKNCFYGTEYKSNDVQISAGLVSPDINIQTEISNNFKYEKLEQKFIKDISDKKVNEGILQNNITLNRLLDIYLDVQSEGEYKKTDSMIMYHDLIKYLRLYEEFEFLKKKGNSNYNIKFLFYGEGSIDDKRERKKLQDILNLEPFRMLEIEKSELQKVDELYYFEIFNIIDNYEQSKKDEILNLPYFVKLKKDTDIEKPSMTKIPAIINKIKGMITIQQADLKGLYKEIIEDRIEQMMYEEMGNIYSDDYKDCKDNESIYSVIITKIGERIGNFDQDTITGVLNQFKDGALDKKVDLYTLGFRLYHSTDVSTFPRSIVILPEEITEASNKNISPGVTSLTPEAREKIIKELKLEKLIEAYDEIKDKFDSNIFTERQKKKSIETEIIKMIMDLEDINYDSNYNHRRKEEVEELWKIDAEINSLNEKIKTPKPEGVTTLADEQKLEDEQKLKKKADLQEKINVLKQEKTKLEESVVVEESITKQISERINKFNDNNKQLFLTYNYVLQHLPEDTTNRNKILDAVNDKSKLNYEKYFEVERDIRISLDFPEYILTGSQINEDSSVPEDDLTTYYKTITGQLTNKTAVEEKITLILDKEKNIAAKELEIAKLTNPNTNKQELENKLKPLQSELNKLQDDLAKLKAVYK